MKNLPAIEKAMHIGELAVALGVAPRTVRRYVDKLYPDLMKNGHTTWLNEIQVTAVKLDLEKNKHLDTSVQLPKTDLEKELLIQQAMTFQAEKIENLQAKIEQQAQQIESDRPAVDFHDKIQSSPDSTTVGQLAKIITKNGFKIGRNRMFQYLRDEKYLMISNEPYQIHMNSGLFEVVPKPGYDDDGREFVNNNLYITGKGQIHFCKLLAPTPKTDNIQMEIA